MCRVLKKIAYIFYAKEIYINFLTYISEIPEDDNDKYRHDYNLVMIDQLKAKYEYNEKELDLARNYLIHSGYLVETGNTKNLFITNDGMKFLQDYYRFCMQGKWGKFTTIFNKNFTAICIMTSIVISTFSLVVSFASYLKK